MCGFIVTSKSFSTEKLFEISQANISYRGTVAPLIDSTDNFNFCFVRLPIVDVSNRSNQPFRWNKHTIVFNGELYNYKEIRDDLIQNYNVSFNSISDVEVFLKGFILYGPKRFFMKAVGMWSYTIEDDKSNLFWGRDQFGIKPLYYSLNNNITLLSSSIPALCSILDLNTSNIIDSSLSTFLVYGYLDPVKLPLIEPIKCAEPGYLYSKNVRGEISKLKVLYDDACIVDKSIRSVIDQVVNSQIPLEVNFSIALSGGLDSNILAYSLAKNNNDFHALSLDLPCANPENSFIDKTVNDLNIQHEYISVDSIDILNETISIVQKLGQPLRSSQPVYQSFLRNRANQLGSKVFFTGDGADEIFGGYVQGFYYFLNDNLNEININQFLDFIGNELPKEMNILNELIKKKCKIFNLNKSWENIFKFHKYFLPEEPSNILEYMDFRLMKHPMPYWLATEDVVSLKNQIETRIPFLDQRTVAIAKNQNIRSIYAKGMNKANLRKQYNDLPNHVKQLKQKFPRPADTVNIVYSHQAINYILEFINSNLFRNLNIANYNEVLQQYTYDIRDKNPNNADNWFRFLTASFFVNNL